MVVLYQDTVSELQNYDFAVWNMGLISYDDT
jgi:hypothetical protein